MIYGVFSSLLCKAPPKYRAHLLAAQKKESGAWLYAPLPPSISSLGLHMEDTVITISVGIRLGSPLCSENICQHCGQDVDVSGTHGLSCWRSQGQIPRHRPSTISLSIPLQPLTSLLPLTQHVCSFKHPTILFICWSCC